jgi:hypothetical protein
LWSLALCREKNYVLPLTTTDTVTIAEVAKMADKSAKKEVSPVKLLIGVAGIYGAFMYVGFIAILRKHCCCYAFLNSLTAVSNAPHHPPTHYL